MAGIEVANFSRGQVTHMGSSWTHVHPLALCASKTSDSMLSTRVDSLRNCFWSLTKTESSTDIDRSIISICDPTMRDCGSLSAGTCANALSRLVRASIKAFAAFAPSMHTISSQVSVTFLISCKFVRSFRWKGNSLARELDGEFGVDAFLGRATGEEDGLEGPRKDARRPLMITEHRTGRLNRQRVELRVVEHQ